MCCANVQIQLQVLAAEQYINSGIQDSKRSRDQKEMGSHRHTPERLDFYEIFVCMYFIFSRGGFHLQSESNERARLKLDAVPSVFDMLYYPT